MRPCAGRPGRIVDLDQAGDRLLLQPLARVPRINLRGLGELVNALGSTVVQRPIEVETGAEVNAEQFEGADGGLREAFIQAAGHHGLLSRGMGKGRTVPGPAVISLRSKSVPDDESAHLDPGPDGHAASQLTVDQAEV